jgi:hypothetical protein
VDPGGVVDLIVAAADPGGSVDHEEDEPYNGVSSPTTATTGVDLGVMVADCRV